LQVEREKYAISENLVYQKQKKQLILATQNWAFPAKRSLGNRPQQALIVALGGGSSFSGFSALNGLNFSSF
jgi:hypothetical protein